MELPLEPRLSIGYQNVLAPPGYDDAEGAAAGRDLPETVRLLDSLGFDSIWSGDHVAFAGPILDPLVQLAQVGRAERSAYRRHRGLSPAVAPSRRR